MGVHKICVGVGRGVGLIVYRVCVGVGKKGRLAVHKVYREERRVLAVFTGFVWEWEGTL